MADTKPHLHKHQLTILFVGSSVMKANRNASRAPRRAPTTTLGMPLAELPTPHDLRWAIIERYILDSLLDTTIGNEPVTHEAATQAATEIESDVANVPRLSSSKQWNPTNDPAVHGARIRLIKLVLGLRETHRGDLLTDELFLKRWTRISRIFDYHDHHWVSNQREQARATAGSPQSSLAFPDDGTTSMFELGRRVWLNQRKPITSPRRNRVDL